MPNRPSSIKNLRKSKRLAVINLRRLKKMRRTIRNFKKLIKEGKFEEATNAVSKVYQAIDKASKRDVIKKNTAIRKKSRLMRLLRKQLLKNKQAKS